jgi:hypothetical protein
MAAILAAILGNPAVQTAITGIIVAAIGYGGTWLAAWIKAKAKGTQFENAVGQMTTFMEASVLKVEQTLVPLSVAAMADGKLTAEEKTKLQQAAWNCFVSSIGGDAGLDKAAKSMGMSRPQLENFASSLLESLVYKCTEHKA